MWTKQSSSGKVLSVAVVLSAQAVAVLNERQTKNKECSVVTRRNN